MYMRILYDKTAQIGSARWCQDKVLVLSWIASSFIVLYRSFAGSCWPLKPGRLTCSPKASLKPHVSHVGGAAKTSAGIRCRSTFDFTWAIDHWGCQFACVLYLRCEVHSMLLNQMYHAIELVCITDNNSHVPTKSYGEFRLPHITPQCARACQLRCLRRMHRTLAAAAKMLPYKMRCASSSA